jgi:hypothetical protein
VADLAPWARRPEDELTRTEEEERVSRRNRRGAALGYALAVLLVVFGYAGFGVSGLLVVLSVVAVGVLVVLVGVVAEPTPRPRRPRRSRWVEAPYPSFEEVRQQLSWGQVSPRHFDLTTCPLLQRVLADRLAERHGVDLYRQPERARALVGEDAWPWLDPAREPSRDSQPPGVDDRTLAMLVTRLEEV